jgi:hypothetical protein
LKPLAVDVIYCRLKNALEMPLTEDERLFLKQRENQLERIANGQDVVDPPDNPIQANFEQTIPSPKFGRKPREFTRESQDG